MMIPDDPPPEQPAYVTLHRNRMDSGFPTITRSDGTAPAEAITKPAVDPPVLARAPFTDVFAPVVPGAPWYGYDVGATTVLAPIHRPAEYLCHRCGGPKRGHACPKLRRNYLRKRAKVAAENAALERDAAAVLVVAAAPPPDMVLPVDVIVEDEHPKQHAVVVIDGADVSVDALLQASIDVASEGEQEPDVTTA